MIGQTPIQKKINSFMKEKKKKNEIPISIISFFLIMQFIYGFNFGFIGMLNKKIRRFCELIGLLICLYTGVILMLGTPIFLLKWDVTVLWATMYSIQYCGHSILLYFSKYKVYNFIRDLRKIDDSFMHSKEHKIGSIICIVFGNMTVLIVILLAIVCIVTNVECLVENKYANFMYAVALSGLDAIVLVKLMVNLYTYYAVLYLAGLVGREKVSLISKQFICISECCEKFGKCYGHLVVMELIGHMPIYLTLVCEILYNIKDNGKWPFYLIRLPHVVYVTLQMCVPAVVVEVVNKQMESLKFKLYKRLMEEKDKEKHLELSNLLSYIEQKPLYGKAWRVIPNDINLVVALFNFFTTYVIVIVQFMHIY